MGSVFISLRFSFGKAHPSAESVAINLCSFASFIAEAMIWWIFRAILGLRHLVCFLLSIQSIRPFSNSFL